MSFVRYISGLEVRLLLAVALLTAAVSCVKEDLPADDTFEDADDRLAVSATVSPGGNTRAYIEEGDLVDGTYYMLYYKKSGSSGTYRDSNAYVDFGYKGTNEDPGTGYAYYIDEDGVTRKDLKWRSIYGEGQTARTFYLSNLNPDSYTYHSASNSSYWSHFKPKSPNPYVAGPLDRENGTNDIIAGSATAKAGEKIEFELNHILALLRINIEIYPSTDSQNHYIDLSNAKVTISNLATEVIDINLMYPRTFKYNASSSVTPGYYDNNGFYTKIRKDDDPVVLVNLTENAAAEETIAWEEGLNGKDLGGKKVYATQPFVFPPQTIPPTTSTATNVINRPKLVVEVPTKDATGAEGATGTITYSGYIPTVMFDVDEDGNIITNSSPEDIALRSGYQLTITATINSPNLELIFAPVKIERWVGKGEYSFKLKQSGIYNANDFDAFVQTYNDLITSDDPNWQLLEKFGYVDETGHLVIQTWASISLDLDKISGALISRPGANAPDFSFVFNGYTITLTEEVPGSEKPHEIGELFGREGQAKLFRIVTDGNYDYRQGGDDESFAGIDSAEKLRTLIGLLSDTNSTKLEDVAQYGAINNIDNTLVFDVSDSFEIDLEEFFQKVPEKIWGYTISFTLKSGKKLTVNVPDRMADGDADDAEGGQLECTSGDVLSRLAINYETKGIYSADELYALIDCYNNLYTLYPDLLKAFGTQNSSTDLWTFTIRKSFTVDGNRVFLSMIPDPENGRPKYSASHSSSSYTITYSHSKIPFTATGYIYQILSGTGAADRNNRLSDIVTYYNNANKSTSYFNLWQYGRFDTENNKWIIPLTYTGTTSSSQQYISYSSLFGKMVSDERNGLYDYEFVIGGYGNRFEVRNMPNSGADDTEISHHYFFQDGNAEYNYPNSAEDLKRVANGTYWEYYEQWKEQNN